MASAVALLALGGAERAGATAFAAGLFAGAAAMITPTRGALVGAAVIASVLALGRARWLPGTLGGLALVPAGMVIFVAAGGVLAAAFADVVLFPARQYAGIQFVAFGAFTAPHHALAVAFFPLTAALMVAAAGLERAALWREPRFRVSLALALAGFLGTFPRADLAHINFSAPLACPLFALLAARLLWRCPHRLRIAIAAGAIVLWTAAVGYAVERKVIPMLRGPLREVPTARGVFVAPVSPWTDAVAALVAHVEAAPPSDAFFFYPYSPMLPYLTGRRHAGPLDVLLPGYTTAAQFEETCARVVREARWVVIDRVWSEPRVLRAFFPSMADPDPPEKRRFEAALRDSFARVAYASRVFELRERSPGASEVACAVVAP
jgi:hypothetical protein